MRPSVYFSPMVVAFLVVAFSAVLSLGNGQIIKLEKMFDSSNRPVGLVGQSNQLFTIEQNGRIVIYANGSVRNKPFLDITDRVQHNEKGYDEQGLLGLVFDPDFKNNKYFYVNYVNKSKKTVISRFTAITKKKADPNSELEINSFSQPFGNHNGGALMFGPDGYLYISTGDGGSANDPQNNSQNGKNFLGKILRIDVSDLDGEGVQIPPDNPFVDDSDFLNEIWAYGLRNPWRISFDRVTGDMLIGDVGQNKYEEVNFQPASSTGGENYGWRPMEGKHCFDPSTNCDPGGTLTKPILEYPHEQGDCSITGGFVYRGRKYPNLKGTYLYGDWCTGRIWGATKDDPQGLTWTSTLLLSSNLEISTFGEDEKGEPYLAHWGSPWNFDGKGGVYKIIGEKCSNDPGFSWKRPQKTCDWISTKNKTIKDKLCSKRAVRRVCKKTCTDC